MLPDSSEQNLVRWQFEVKASIFGCDAHAVYSSRPVEVAPGLRTRAVDSDLRCSRGGQFGTALNTPIFVAVWAKVIQDGRFAMHDWVVKVDPDTVFLPARLRTVVARHQAEASAPEGVYLNNCQFGLHGPIEVFSTNAVKRWGNGTARCLNHFWKVCSGDCFWGEDMLIDQCLSEVLHVRRENEYVLLAEEHCAPLPGWQECTDPSRVAFHPFKALALWQQCWKNAIG